MALSITAFPVGQVAIMCTVRVMYLNRANKCSKTTAELIVRWHVDWQYASL